MLSKAKIKYIRSLGLKKFRHIHHAFVAEGNKLVEDMLPTFECELLIAKTRWMATQGDLPAGELFVADEGDIEKASFLKTPQDVIAVFKLPNYSIKEATPESELVLALDGVQDPGNLGTIIRLADWFGIRHILCSPDSVDAFGPKAIQASMGALAHVSVHYTDLSDYLSNRQAETPVYGTYLDGENLYAQPLSTNGILLMGSEGQGIRPYLEPFVGQKLFIPGYPAERKTSESLNVAIATAIVCGEFRRRNGQAV